MFGKQLAKNFLPTLLIAALLQGCGSGAVSAPPTTSTTPLSVFPPSSDLFPDLPVTFTITGGNQPFTVFTSNSAALPAPGAITGASFTLVAQPVLADTAVDITVRDSNNASSVVRGSIKPSTLNNQVTFTPLAPTGTGCAGGLCGGGDAQVVVKAVQANVVLRNRPIRFEVFQGSFSIVTPGSGALVSSLVVNTDEQGEAVVRISAPAGASTQVATIQTTDVTTGLNRRYNFNIIQQVSGQGVITVLPSGSITVTGAKGATGQQGICPFGPSARVDFYVYGGTPPYAIRSPLPNVLTVLQSTVDVSGGGFTAQVQDCGRSSLIITDARGLAIETAPLEGARGPSGDAAPAQTLAVSPSTVTLGCGQSVSLALTGSGSFTATRVQSVDSTLFVVTPTAGSIPNSVTISRASTGTISTGNGGGAVLPSVTVNFVSGSTVVPVTVSLSGGLAPVAAGDHRCS